MEDKYERILEEVKRQFVPSIFSDKQVDVVEKACKYIFSNIHHLINLLE